MAEPRDTSAGGDTGPPSGGGADRLDSWKEIAAFLKRDVRTVQRWEKRAGLPVYRHHSSKLRTAYAYRSELDRWWRQNREAVEDGHAPPPGLARGRPPLLMAFAILLLVVFSPSDAVPHRPPPGDAQAPLVHLVLATAQNATTDAGLDRLLDDALERTLGPDRQLRVMAPAERNRILRLMRLAPAASLPLPLAREVAVRAGEGALVVAARVQPLSSHYLVDVDLVDPGDGRIVGSVEAETSGGAGLHAAVHEEARRIAGLAVLAARAHRLPPAEALEPVTTRSLSAVRLYTQAVAAGRRSHWATSELLARRAAAADDQFAAAHAWIAWAMRRQGRRLEDCLPIVDKARALASDATDREHYLIDGTYYMLSGDVARAMASLEALLRVYPTDQSAVDRLIECYVRTGRIRQAVERAVSRADVSPDDFYANVRAAHALRIWNADPRRAERFLSRSRRLLTTESRVDRPAWTAWLSVMPAFERWLARDPRGVLAAAGRLDTELGSKVGRELDAFATGIGFSYLSVGRLRQAEDVFRRASTPTRQIDLALLALSVGDRKGARTWLEQIREYSSERPALFARVGLVREAELGLAASAGSELSDGVAAVTAGLIAARRHDTDSAIDQLRLGIDRLRYSGEPEYFMAVDVLSRLWLRLGDRARAVRLLSDTLGQRARSCGSARWPGAQFVKIEADLLVATRGIGPSGPADQARADLQQILQAADADHPFLRLVRQPHA
jgi:tetratricopeptide (TPR) repeat protein